jgi:probable rRNA maturation factor
MIELEIQRMVDDPGVPSDEQFRHWVNSALATEGDVMVNLRVVDEAESWALNRQWRGKDSSTNVLGFPADAPPVDGCRVLGDVVLCAPVIAREAIEQDKTLSNHWAHMVIHGLLHLTGFDHIDGKQAEIMEAREREILADLDIPDPYETQDDS